MVKYKKRFRVLFMLVLAISILFIGAIPVRANGDTNVDGGGGSTTGGATSENTSWPTSMPQGFRATIVDAQSGTKKAGPIDITDDATIAKLINYSFGSTYKLTYKAGASLRIQTKYYFKLPDVSLPKIVEQDSIDEAKEWFTNKVNQQWLCSNMNFNYDLLVNDETKGNYKILFEPVVYVKYLNKLYAMTATEAALFAKQHTDFRTHLRSLVSGSLPLSAYLEWDDLGIKAYTGATSGWIDENTIVTQLGVGIVYFGNEPGQEPEVPEEPDNPDAGSGGENPEGLQYDFSCSSVTVLTDPVREENPMEVTASFGFRAQVSCNTCGGSGQLTHKEWVNNADYTGGHWEVWHETCGSCGGEGKSWWSSGHNEPQPSRTATVEIYVKNGALDNTQGTTGALIHSTSITLNAEESQSVSCTLNAGENIGDKEIIARINWDDRNREYDPNNNQSTTVAVCEPATNLEVSYLEPNAPFRTGTDVISSFRILNQDIGALRIRPKHNLTAEFTARNPSTGEIVGEGAASGIIIPKNGTNLVYFKWHVPEGYSASNVELRCDINTGGGVNETEYSDNTATGENEVQRFKVQEPPDTVFEDRPVSFSPPTGSESIPTVGLAHSVIQSISYEQWSWDGNASTGWYQKEQYGLRLSSQGVLVPDEQSPSRSERNGSWSMRSGYGVTLTIDSSLSGNGRAMPPSEAYTTVQNGNAYFPEFKYKLQKNKYRTLEETAPNRLEFERSPYTNTNKGEKDYRRIHFTPLWYPDGGYQVKTYVYDCWTPCGMLSMTASVPAVTISGNMYDDWFVNHSKRSW